MPTYPSNINDKELIQIFTYLEQINLISIKWTGVNHNDLTAAVDITLLPSGINYFNFCNSENCGYYRQDGRKGL